MKILYASRSHIEMKDAVREVYFGFLLDRYVLPHSFSAGRIPTYAQIKKEEEEEKEKKEREKKKTFVPLRSRCNHWVDETNAITPFLGTCWYFPLNFISIKDAWTRYRFRK